MPVEIKDKEKADILVLGLQANRKTMTIRHATGELTIPPTTAIYLAAYLNGWIKKNKFKLGKFDPDPTCVLKSFEVSGD